MSALAMPGLLARTRRVLPGTRGMTGPAMSVPLARSGRVVRGTRA
jgi:hypothetical protein